MKDNQMKEANKYKQLYEAEVKVKEKVEEDAMRYMGLYDQAEKEKDVIKD